MSDPPADGPTTVCPECAVGCHLRRPIEGSRAEGVPGPANPNGRLCRKGVAAFEAVAGERLERPLVRRDGEGVPVDWETAYGRAAEGIREVIEEHGPDGLAFLGAPHCTNEENYLLGKLARTLGTNDVDNRARLCHVATARALRDRLGWPATTNGLEDLGEADVIIVAGANPAERQPVAFNAFVRPAVNDGATLVHVDPVGNRTTRLADVHLAPKPGTDAVVFDLLCAGVTSAGGVDRRFVEERTREYGAFAAGMEAFDPESAVAAADVDPTALERVSSLVADADRVAALTGTGIEGGDGEARAPDALLNLLLLTGNLGKPGTGLYVLRGLVNEQGTTDAGCVPDRLPGHGRVTDPEARARVEAEWGVEVPSDPGRTASELLAAFGEDVHGAVVVGENPAVSKRDEEWIRRRLDALETLVVVDVAPNGTTDRADVVLPAAAGLEKAGTVTNLDRRVQRITPTGPPPGEARPDFEVLRELGGRLVGEEHFDFAGPAAAFEEMARVAPTHDGVAYDDLDGGGHRWPFGRDGVLYRESFDTADGLAPLVPPGPVPGDDGGADGLRLVTGGRAGEGAAEERLRIHPRDADELGIGSGDRVGVSAGDATVETTVTVEEDVRRGTVYLHAAVADPLLRTGASTVAVERGSREGDGDG